MNGRSNKPKHTTAFHFKVHTPNLYTEDTSNLELIQDHPDIVQAKTNREGILERIDYKGENTNENIRVKENDNKHEKEETSDDEKEDEGVKYKPGERLLMTIMQERPELLYKQETEKKVMNRKRITTKRKTKLKKISDALRNR
jgi:hypothetical protein